MSADRYSISWAKLCLQDGCLSSIRNVEPPTRPRLEYRRETGLILRCDRKVGNPFQTKQGVFLESRNFIWHEHAVIPD